MISDITPPLKVHVLVDILASQTPPLPASLLFLRHWDGCPGESRPIVIVGVHSSRGPIEQLPLENWFRQIMEGDVSELLHDGAGSGRVLFMELVNLLFNLLQFRCLFPGSFFFGVSFPVNEVLKLLSIDS